MIDGIVIRPGRPADLPELRALTIAAFHGVSLEQMVDQRLGAWGPLPWQQRKGAHIDADFATHPEGVFVAERDGRIVGYITTVIDAAAQRGRIPNLAVAEEVRNCGLGRRLIEAALDDFRRRGLAIAQIETMESNPIGQHLYPACGFEEVGRQIHYARRL